jgi:hypothetical protein
MIKKYSVLASYIIFSAKMVLKTVVLADYPPIISALSI